MPDLDFGRFAEFYAAVSEPAVLELERRVLGTDYGANGYTDAGQAERLAELLGIDGASRLLDLGSGAGWPGVFIARRTGCRAVLADVPVAGLTAAAARARAEAAHVDPVAADGEFLPFREASFDAVSHADVLC